MARRKTILAILDPTNRGEQPVIERAARLARAAGAGIELYICDFDADIDTGRVATIWIPQPEAKAHLLDIHRENLENIAETLRKRNLSVTVNVRWDHPLGSALVRKIAASRPWLVAKDTHHLGILKQTILSNTDWDLIRGCPAPMLLVKPQPLQDRPRVIAAVDPVHANAKLSGLDDVIFNMARAVAGYTNGELHLVHCGGSLLGLDLPPSVKEHIMRESRDALEEFIRAHPEDGVQVHLLDGRPEERLPAIAEKLNASLVVMGSVSRRGFDRLVLGNTAERTLDRLPCDLLVMKPRGFDYTVPHG